MDTSTGSPTDWAPEPWLKEERMVERFVAAPVPELHPAEPDIFARHAGVPGHVQAALGKAHIVLIGCGGLNSWVALGLARSGATHLTLIDHDLVEKTNLPRQLYLAGDLGHPKACRLARNVVDHAVAGAEITGVAVPFPEALAEIPMPVDLFVVGVDANLCRLDAVREAKRRRIPAVFSMLSRDGTRCQCFLQGPHPDGPCLWCAASNLDLTGTAPCAAAIITSCFLAASFAVFFAHRALMGWPDWSDPFNWREADLLGIAPDCIGRVTRRANCPVCAEAA